MTPPLWLDYLRALWPVVVVLVPVILVGGFLWLQTKFALRAELETERQRINAKAAAHDLETESKRVDVVERSIAYHDGRLIALEKDCQSDPTRNQLQQELSNLSQRMRGVEVGLEGVGRHMATHNDYLHALIQKDLK